MRQHFKCLHCDGRVDVIDITGNWATVECVDCGVHSVEIERAEGQGSLFGISMAEHIFTCLLILATLLSIVMLSHPEAASIFWMLNVGG